MQSNTALLIIDVQMAMFADSDPVYQGEALLAKLSQLIDKARTAGIPVIFIQHNTGQSGDLAEGSPEWQIHPDITPMPGEVIVHKRHPDSFQDTILQTELKKKGITHLIIAGIQTEFCIDTTCRRAYSLGYEAILVKDAHSTWDTKVLKAQQIIDHHNLVLGDWFAKPQTADEIDI
ncbi:MAG: cysteine hydrolase [Anaerolineales bacterium]|nr:cysteine hydrolase [Anaerolineales bacterium]